MPTRAPECVAAMSCLACNGASRNTPQLALISTPSRSNSRPRALIETGRRQIGRRAADADRSSADSTDRPGTDPPVLVRRSRRESGAQLLPGPRRVHEVEAYMSMVEHQSRAISCPLGRPPGHPYPRALESFKDADLMKFFRPRRIPAGPVPRVPAHQTMRASQVLRVFARALPETRCSRSVKNVAE